MKPVHEELLDEVARERDRLLDRGAACHRVPPGVRDDYHAAPKQFLSIPHSAEASSRRPT
jgi:hypothetical protein